MIWFWNSRWIVGADPQNFWFIAIFLIAVTMAAFIGMFLFWKRLQLIENTPRSLIRSAAQGYVELQGLCKLMPGEPIMSPLTSTRCVWWSYSIEERSGNRRQGWTTLQQGISDNVFFIMDDSGHCAIDPEHAQVYPSSRQVWYGDTPEPLGSLAAGRFQLGANYKYTESCLYENDPLYALGYFHTQGPVSVGDINEEVRQLLVEWKRDQAALKQRFDANHDGEVDQAEWDSARAEARREVLASEREAMTRPPVSLLSRPPDGRPFILSNQSQKNLATRFRLYAFGCLLLFFVAGASVAHMITLRLASSSPSVPIRAP
ncbi:MAG TPA: GIDE domain-containing protein [Gammaproteobacteria bacterium]|nr:GIDE domain-containing protein [Gammaproteobacteria bacterium]